MRKLSLSFFLVSLLPTLSPLYAASPTGKAALKKWGIPYPTVIAHRGASYDAPEETLPAYEVAREWGADYLEADLQRTKDGVLICLHDTSLKRTTNIHEVFPERAQEPVSAFTLSEIKKLDAGSWFNKAYPFRARASYTNLKILTLEELMEIASSGKNKPGLYLETKEPRLFPGIEKDLSTALKKRGWIGSPGKARVILQTFDKTSLSLLHQYLPEVPLVFLLWLDDGAMASTTPEAKLQPGQSLPAFRATLKVTEKEFEKWILYAKKEGASGTGPGSTLKDLGEQSYMDLVKPWMNKITHKNGLFIHAYTVDTLVDMKELSRRGVDGFFTNRADLLLQFYGRKPIENAEEILKRLNF